MATSVEPPPKRARPYPLRQVDYLQGGFDPRAAPVFSKAVDNALMLLGAKSNLGGPRNYELDTAGIPWQLTGPNEYLRDTVDVSVTEMADFYTSVLLPWSSNPNPNITWNQLTMDQPLAQRVPAGGVTPLLRADLTQHSDKAVRRGLAIRIDRDFMVSSAGQESFALALQGLIRAVRTTVNFGVLTALVDAAPPPRAVLHADADPRPSALLLARDEATNFACLQKQPNAVRQVLALAREHRRSRSAEIDTLVLPPGAGLYIRFRPEELGSFEKPASGEPVRLLGCNVYEAEWMPVGSPDTGQQVDVESPLLQDREVGEVYIHHGAGEDEEGCYLYDEEIDNWRLVPESDLVNIDSKVSEDIKAEAWFAACRQTPPAHPCYALAPAADVFYDFGNEKFKSDPDFRESLQHRSPTLFPSLFQDSLGDTLDLQDNDRFRTLDDAQKRHELKALLRNNGAALFIVAEACTFDKALEEWWNADERPASEARKRDSQSDAFQKKLTDFCARIAAAVTAGDLAVLPLACYAVGRKYREPSVDSYKAKLTRLLTVRPFIKHRMGSAVALKAGSETGQTMYGHNDFQITEDNVSQCYYGNLTFYSKSVVTQPNNVSLVRDVFACGYVSGCSLDAIDTVPKDTKPTDASPDTLTAAGGSVFQVRIPEHDPAFGVDGVAGPPIDITGCYPPGSPLSRAAGGADDAGLHWCGAATVYLSMMGERTLGMRTFWNAYLAALEKVDTQMLRLYWQTAKQHNTLALTGTFLRTASRGADPTTGAPRARLPAPARSSDPVCAATLVRGNGHWAGLTYKGAGARRAGQPGRG